MHGSVGRRGRNTPEDVTQVQELLNRHVARLGMRPLVIDGKVGSKTVGAIEAFQERVVRMRRPDGRVDPGGRTLAALRGESAPAGSLPNQARISSSPPPDFDLNAFLGHLDRDASLSGVRVVYFDGFRIHVLREGPPYCGPGQNAVVIREPTETSALVSAEAANKRDSKMFIELLGVGLSCSAAVVGWAVMIGSGAAAPLTGGTSTFLTYLAAGATMASTAQCANSVMRSIAEYNSPEWLDMLDSEAWYRKTSVALDVISLAGAATATAATVRLALSLRATTGKTMVQVLRGLSRQQRKKLAEEAVRIQQPGISNGQLKALVRAGVYPKRFTSLEIGSTIRNQLLDAAGAAMSFTGSAVSGALHDSGKLVVGMARSVETYR